MNGVVKTDGVNGLTRTNLITAIKGLTDFDAGGMLGTRSFKDGKTNELLPDGAVQGRPVSSPVPDEEGTFDCKASNAVTIKGNLLSN